MTRRRRSPKAETSILLRRHGPWSAMLVAVLALVALRLWGDGTGPADAPPVDPADAARDYFVRRVVDGDTLLLSTGDRVRLIGVDTPESVKKGTPVQPFGPEASRFTKERVEGKTVRLEFDKERQDRYGRILAYVYIDGALLNEELLRAGLGRALLQFPYSNVMKKRFRAAESEAREARRGIWSLPEEAAPPKRRAA